MACKPGFKPINSLFKGQLIQGCQKIDHCSTENHIYVNQCGKCSSGYAFNFNTEKKVIEWDSCVKLSDEENNCLAFETNKRECMACKENYYLNSESQCERIVPLNCNDLSFLNSEVKSLSFNNPEYQQYLL